MFEMFLTHRSSLQLWTPSTSRW